MQAFAALGTWSDVLLDLRKRKMFPDVTLTLDEMANDHGLLRADELTVRLLLNCVVVGRLCKRVRPRRTRSYTLSFDRMLLRTFIRTSWIRVGKPLFVEF